MTHDVPIQSQGSDPGGGALAYFRMRFALGS
jgi:hypothetical protein